MDGNYAYLVVEHHTYWVEPPVKAPPADSPSDTDHQLPFALRLRQTLDVCGKYDGYGSLDAMLNSPRQRPPQAARAEHVRRLVESGLLQQDGAVNRMLGGVVPEPAWKVLKEIEPEKGEHQPVPVRRRREARTTAQGVRSWSMKLYESARETEFPVDHGTFPQSTLPLAAVLETLDQLAKDGWYVRSLSEDRSIADDASRSFVIRQRYLLARAQ